MQVTWIWDFNALKLLKIADTNCVIFKFCTFTYLQSFIERVPDIDAFRPFIFCSMSIILLNEWGNIIGFETDGISVSVRLQRVCV